MWSLTCSIPYAMQLIGSHYGIALFSVACCLDFSKHQKHMMLKAGNAHLNSEALILKGEVSVRLTSLYLLIRNQLFQDKLRFFFSFLKQPSPNW